MPARRPTAGAEKGDVPQMKLRPDEITKVLRDQIEHYSGDRGRRGGRHRPPGR